MNKLVMKHLRGGGGGGPHFTHSQIREQGDHDFLSIGLRSGVTVMVKKYLHLSKHINT